MARRTPRIEEIMEKWHGLFDALNHETDAVCAIVGAAYVDHCLGSLLAKRLIKGDTATGLLKPGGAIGELAAKAKLSYCLGLISKGLLQNIDNVASIRNEFAHTLDTSSFDAAVVADCCKKLSLPRGGTIRGPSDMSVEDAANFIVAQFTGTNRGRFVRAIGMICTTIVNKAIETEECKHVPDKWT